jgi:tRNA/tmRNA/rRNA uracil-C5-methylase (TrmA/RlmC/RlmD family)
LQAVVKRNKKNATSCLIELNCFSGLIAFGAIGRKWNMVHRTSAVPNALAKAKASVRAKALTAARFAAGRLAPSAAKPDAGEKKWKMGPCRQTQ